MAIEFAEKTRRIPVYPVAAGYNLGSEVAMLASNEAAFGPLEPVVEAARRAMIAANRYPDPSYTELRQALADRYGVPWERIALGSGSCDLILAAGEALLEPGAEVVYAWPAFSVYPHLAAASGARAIEVPLTSDGRPRPRRDRGRDHGRDTAGARLQPEQPDQHRAATRADRGLPREGPGPRLRDSRRGICRVLADDRRSVRVAAAARPPSRIW